MKQGWGAVLQEQLQYLGWQSRRQWDRLRNVWWHSLWVERDEWRKWTLCLRKMVMAGKGGGRKPLTEEVVRTSDSSRKCMSPQQENLTRPKVTWRASVITTGNPLHSESDWVSACGRECTPALPLGREGLLKEGLPLAGLLKKNWEIPHNLFYQEPFEAVIWRACSAEEFSMYSGACRDRLRVRRGWVKKIPPPSRVTSTAFSTKTLLTMLVLTVCVLRLLTDLTI